MIEKSSVKELFDRGRDWFAAMLAIYGVVETRP